LPNDPVEGTVVVIDGNGNTIDGSATYTMTAVQNGVKGSVSVVFLKPAGSGVGWYLF